MGRITLELAQGLHQPSLTAGYRLLITRLLVNVCLRTRHGWTPARKAVLDTGAAVSLLPKSVWRDAAATLLVPVRAAGVVNRPECTIAATLATVDCTLLHETDRIGPLTIHALLADSDRVPYLLGVCGILDRAALTVDLRKPTAMLETS